MAAANISIAHKCFKEYIKFNSHYNSKEHLKKVKGKFAKCFFVILTWKVIASFRGVNVENTCKLFSDVWKGPTLLCQSTLEKDTMDPVRGSACLVFHAFPFITTHVQPERGYSLSGGSVRKGYRVPFSGFRYMKGKEFHELRCVKG